MKRVTIATIAVIVASLLVILPGCSSAKKEVEKSTERKVKNVILMIGDGMGFNHVRFGSLYQKGKADAQVYHQFPVKIAASTYYAGHQYDTEQAQTYKYLKEYVPTDSAAAGSALATGQKYQRGVLGIADGKKVKTILEGAEEIGLSTGVVTSVPFAHATPAAFSAHNVLRSNYEEIAREQINVSALEVIMGCGHPLYDNNGDLLEEADFKYVGDENSWNKLKSGKAGADADNDGIADPWTLIQEPGEFRKLMKGDTPKRVLGVPKVRKTLQAYRNSPDDNYDDDQPFEVPFLESVPTLAEMSLGALNVLDNNEEGFVLMIEGGAIDWACHANAPGRLIEEQIGFNKTIDAVVAWVEENSSWEETLLIITADHETGLLLGAGSGPEGMKAIEDFPKGQMPEVHWGSLDHSNQLVPLFAKGAMSEELLGYADEEDLVRGKYLDNTEISKFIFSLFK